MPLVRINALGDQVVLADGTAPLRSVLAYALRRLPQGAPVMVLIHGFKFSPWHRGKNPHDHILSLSPDTDCWKAVSWPRKLGFGTGNADEGLCIAFGWEASGSIWRAYDEAARAGRALASLSRLIRQLRPGQSIDVLAHSLGGRVALSALPHLASGALRRAVLMTPAEMHSAAERDLDSPAGQAAEFLNITSRENDLFDFLLEWLVAPHRWGDRTLGHSRGPVRDNWLDLQIDHAGQLQALARLGLPVAPAQRRICHWSPYLRSGMFPLYRRFLRDGLPLSTLRAELPDDHCARWSRLFAPPALPLPLPLPGKAPS